MAQIDGVARVAAIGPHRAVAKLGLRLVPDMAAADTLAGFKAHLAKHGFGDTEVKMTGGYDPNSTSPDSRLPGRIGLGPCRVRA